MAHRRDKKRLTHKMIAEAKPRASEYTLWDGTLAHFGVRIHPSGVRAFIVQTRVRGRMRKFTLGRYPEIGVGNARKEAAALLARLWGGEAVESSCRRRAPLFKDFAARYRERRKSRWKPSSLETFDVYMNSRLIPHFGKLRLDAIDHACVSGWFDAVSADRPGAANRAFEILRAMLRTTRGWGELADDVPDACANIVKNPRRPVARYLSAVELKRLNVVLERHRENHLWAVAALRLLTLTGARLSEALNLEWEQIGELSNDGASVRLGDSKTGPRTLWLGTEAAELLGGLPRADGAVRVFPDELTTDKLHAFWRGVREEAGLPGLRIHDLRHTWASQGVMNGVGLTTVGRLLGHRRRETTAVYAHLDDAALRDAAAQAASVIARAMGFSAGAPTLPDGGDIDWLGGGEKSVPMSGSHSFSGDECDVDWLGVNSQKPDSGSQVRDMSEPSKGFGLLWI